MNRTINSSTRDRFDIDFSEIHQTITPADVRDFDQIRARIRLRDTAAGNYDEVRVWRLSPLGVEIVCNERSVPLAKAAKVDLEMTIGGQTNHFEGLVVDLIKENADIALAGIRFNTPRNHSPANQELRRSQRWLCSEEFFPTCICPTPGRYNEFIYFQVRDISRDGLQLVCSLRNKYLIPGMELNLTASFPMVGDLSIPVKITRIGLRSEREKDLLVVGTEYIDLAPKARNVIGQYLLQFSNVETLAALRQSGFAPTSVARSTDFYFLKSESDYEEVLKLRLMAHRAGGTLGDTADVYDMSDRYDYKSRIIVARHKDRIIASARIHFCPLEDLLEHERYIDWPLEFPRRDTVLEITRVCTHPDFRSNDLLAGLLKFLGVTCFQPQRPWVLISSTDALVPFYQKIGLQLTSRSYSHPIYSGKQNILLTNAFDILRGKGVNPIYWNVIWSDVYQYHLETGALTASALDRARVGVYRLALPVAKVIANISKRPRSK